MSYKTVVAYARSEPELKRVLSAVGLLQQKMADIHVIGIYSIPSPMVYADPNGFIDPGMFELHDKQHKELSEHLKSLFEDEMRRRKARYEFRVARSETGTAADGVLATCLGAELLVAGQPDPDDPSINDETADTLVFHSSCPVLLVPYAPVLPATSLDRIVVAYNGKREASRAAFDALPLLRRASRTDVVWVDPPEPLNDGEAHASTDLVEALARHGIKVEAVPLKSEGLSPPDALREYALAEHVDLMVIGAYSHSRVREFLFGGVTRNLLKSLPALTFLSR
ncbi:MAG: universal stress protein [Rhizobiales bacterium]|nr:universal stress protein [Hyphomicrobiales bacterium]OJX99198.1 MAG: universal stress protein [Rhizobiales bacterium 63-22]